MMPRGRFDQSGMTGQSYKRATCIVCSLVQLKRTCKDPARVGDDGGIDASRTPDLNREMTEWQLGDHIS